MMTSRQSGFPIGGEGNSQTTHGYIVVECVLYNAMFDALDELLASCVVVHFQVYVSKRQLVCKFEFVIDVLNLSLSIYIA